MPKDYFNPPVAAATEQNHIISPQALMFERLVGDMQSALDEEVFFDDSDWPCGFDWGGEAEAVWQGLAEDATMLATFQTRRPMERLLCRAAGVIHRAICAGSLDELEAARLKLVNIMDVSAESRIHFMLEEAQNCLDQMADRAAGDNQVPPAAGFGSAPEA